MFLEISHKKEILAQVFSFEFCEIFKNTFLTEHLRTTASDEGCAVSTIEQFMIEICIIYA